MWIFWTSEEPLFFVLFNLYLANKANLGAPAEYDLQFVEGFADRGLIVEHTPVSKYCRDLFGRVHIKMSMQSDPFENTITADAPVVAIIPEGFRPRQTVIAAAYGWSNNTARGIATIVIRTNGEITAYGVSPYACAQGQITYLAK